MKFSPRTLGQLIVLAFAITVFCTNTSLAQVETTNKAASSWLTMTPTGANASFQVPVKPRYVERSFSPIQGKPPIKVHLHLATTNEGRSTFVFGYHDLHSVPKDTKELNATLDGAVKGSVANVFGQLMEKTESVSFMGAKGRQFIYRYQQTQKVPNSEKTVDKLFIVASRVFILGRRQYQISCLMESSIFEEQLAAKFLNSFLILKDEQKDEPEKSPPNNR